MVRSPGELYKDLMVISGILCLVGVLWSVKQMSRDENHKTLVPALKYGVHSSGTTRALLLASLICHECKVQGIMKYAMDGQYFIFREMVQVQ